MYLLMIQRRLLGISYILFTCLCALLLALVVRLHLTATIAAPTDFSPIPPNQMPQPKIEDFHSVIERNIFNSASTGAVADNRMLVVPELTLIGTVAGPPGLSLALISNRSDENNVEIYRWGDRIRKYQIVAIYRQEVHLTKDGNTIEKLLLAQNPSPGFPAPSHNSAAGLGVQKIGPNSSLLDQNLVSDIMKNPGKFMKELRARPVLEKGQVNGLKLSRIKNEGLPSRLGFQNDDIIRKVNGEGIQGLDSVPELLLIIMSGKPVTIDLDRKGQKTTLRFQFG